MLQRCAILSYFKFEFTFLMNLVIFGGFRQNLVQRVVNGALTPLQGK